MNSGTYRIDLGGDGRFYVGSSCDLVRRERAHRGLLVAGTHGNQIVQRIFDKYGVFVFTVLGRYPVGDLLVQEQVLLDLHHGESLCANIELVAGSSLGVKRSDETKAKLSAAQTGKKHTAETCAKISASKKGKKMPRTAEHSAKIGAAQKGKTLTDEHRAKLSAAHIGNKMPPFTPEHRAKLSAATTAYWARRRKPPS